MDQMREVKIKWEQRIKNALICLSEVDSTERQ